MAAGIADSVDIDINEIKSEIERSVRELIDIAKLEEEDIFVVGCSSSEIAAHMIGTYSSEEIGKAYAMKRAFSLRHSAVSTLTEQLLLRRNAPKDTD